jgi:hypothetical protein
MLNSLNLRGPSEISPGVLFSTTGGMTHFVHASGAGALDLLPPGMATPTPGGFFTSVAAALSAIGSNRNNRGDVINVLQGHTESIASADAWSGLGSTDVTVNCLGRGTARPTFTWTAAGSTMLFDKANFRLFNARLFLAGAHAAGSALTVAAPITVSAAGCEISGCRIFWGFDADQIVGVGITVSGADEFTFNDNKAFSTTAAAPTTTFLQITDSDFLTMHRTTIQGSASATTLGPVQFVTTASLNIDMKYCVIQNQLASSVHAVTGMAANTGSAFQCGFGIMDNATAQGWVTPGQVQLIGCQTSNDAGVGSAGPAA